MYLCTCVHVYTHIYIAHPYIYIYCTYVYIYNVYIYMYTYIYVYYMFTIHSLHSSSTFHFVPRFPFPCVEPLLAMFHPGPSYRWRSLGIPSARQWSKMLMRSAWPIAAFIGMSIPWHSDNIAFKKLWTFDHIYIYIYHIISSVRVCARIRTFFFPAIINMHDSSVCAHVCACVFVCGRTCVCVCVWMCVCVFVSTFTHRFAYA